MFSEMKSNINSCERCQNANAELKKTAPTLHLIPVPTAEIFIPDQGREFCNQVSDKLKDKTGTVSRISSAYHPQTNGMDERFNQTLERALEKSVNSDQNDWDEKLDSILFAYRTSRHDTTKFTPFYLMFGREAVLPIEMELIQKNDQINVQP